jgi:hypothetical protein
MFIHCIDGATLQLPAGSNMERVLLAQYVDFVPQVRGLSMNIACMPVTCSRDMWRVYLC